MTPARPYHTTPGTMKFTCISTQRNQDGPPLGETCGRPVRMTTTQFPPAPVLTWVPIPQLGPGRGAFLALCPQCGDVFAPRPGLSGVTRPDPGEVVL